MQFLKDLPQVTQISLALLLVLLPILVAVRVGKRRAAAAKPADDATRKERRRRARSGSDTQAPAAKRRRKRRWLAAEAGAIDVTPDGPNGAGDHPDESAESAAEADEHIPVASAESDIDDAPGPMIVAGETTQQIADVAEEATGVASEPEAVAAEDEDPYVTVQVGEAVAAGHSVAEPGWPSPGELASGFDPDAFDPLPPQAMDHDDDAGTADVVEQMSPDVPAAPITIDLGDEWLDDDLTIGSDAIASVPGSDDTQVIDTSTVRGNWDDDEDFDPATGWADDDADGEMITLPASAGSVDEIVAELEGWGDDDDEPSGDAADDVEWVEPAPAGGPAGEAAHVPAAEADDHEEWDDDDDWDKDDWDADTEVSGGHVIADAIRNADESGEPMLEEPDAEIAADLDVAAHLAVPFPPPGTLPEHTHTVTESLSTHTASDDDDMDDPVDAVADDADDADWDEADAHDADPHDADPRWGASADDLGDVEPLIAPQAQVLPAVGTMPIVAGQITDRPSSPVVIDLASLVARGERVEMIIEHDADGRGLRLLFGPRGGDQADSRDPRETDETAAAAAAQDPVGATDLPAFSDADDMEQAQQAAADGDMDREESEDSPVNEHAGPDSDWIDFLTDAPAPRATSTEATWEPVDEPDAGEPAVLVAHAEAESAHFDAERSTDAAAAQVTVAPAPPTDPTQVLADIRARLAALDARRAEI